MLFTIAVGTIFPGGVSFCVSQIGCKDIGRTEETIFAELMKS